MTWFSVNNCIVNTTTPKVIMHLSNTMKHFGEQFDRSLAFTKQVDDVVMKAKRVIVTMGVMTTANCKHSKLFLSMSGFGSLCYSVTHK